MIRKLISILLILIGLGFWLPFLGPSPLYFVCIEDIFSMVVVPAIITILLQGEVLPQIVNSLHMRLKFSNTGKTYGLLSGLIMIIPYFIIWEIVMPDFRMFQYIDQSEI